MTRISLLGAVLFAALAAATCQGAIRWQDDYNFALEDAKKTGRPMVVVFDDDGKRYRAKILEAFNKLPASHPRFVFLYTEVSRNGNQVSHALFQKFMKPNQRITLPFILFVDTHDKVLAKLEGSPRPNDLALEMREVLKSYGSVPSAKKAHAAEQMLIRAKALAAKGENGAAARLCQEILALKLKIPATESAKEELAKLEEKANKDLEAASLDVKDKAYAAAVEKLLALERDYASLDAGKKARKLLAELRQLPQAKAAFESLEKEDEQTLTQPRASAPGPTDDPNDIDNDFYTDEELAALDAMAEGEEPKPAKRPPSVSVECRRLLSLARSWIANKRPEKARELLQRVLEKHPNTIYADQAKMLLKELD